VPIATEALQCSEYREVPIADIAQFTPIFAIRLATLLPFCIRRNKSLLELGITPALLLESSASAR
jgi:hypothetical protein